MFIVYFVYASLSPRSKSMCDVPCATCHVRGSKPYGGLGTMLHHDQMMNHVVDEADSEGTPPNQPQPIDIVSHC
jgi:hypothetical protein